MIVTTEAKLRNEEFNNYLDQQVEEEFEMILYIYREMIKPDFYLTYKTTSKFNTHLCRKFGILSRHANSLINLVSGIRDSYIGCKEFELEDKKIRLGKAKEKLEKKKLELDFLKGKAAENRLTEKDRKKMKNLESSIYHLNNKINRYRQKIKTIKRILKNGEVHVGFGTKEMFRKQYHLKENGFKSHQEWKEAFETAKKHYIFSLGRAAEKSGNQIATFLINPENGTLTLRYRKEHVRKGEPKYIYCENIVLNYLKEEFYSVLRSPKSKAVCARFLKRGSQWYVQIIFDLDTIPEWTTASRGVIALDYNHGFIQQGELDSKGNLIGLKKYNLNYHGEGNRALNEMRETAKRIVLEAGGKGKSIVIEDLNFCKTKAEEAEDAEASRVLRKIGSLFDYRRYTQSLSRCAEKNGIELKQVDPRYTTKNAKRWYCPRMKLNSHQGATITIGRRGMGWPDYRKKKG